MPRERGYHLFVKWMDKEGKECNRIFVLNYKEEEVTSQIAVPFNQQVPFYVYGEIIDPVSVKEILIFSTRGMIDTETVLPNGKLIIDGKYDYVLDLLSKQKILQTEHVVQVAGSFLNSFHKIQKASPKTQDISSIRSKVFIVHGRDEISASLLQAHLIKKGINAEMFEDFKQRITGNTTVIEELIKIKDEVSYAFIIATADDKGILCEEIENHIEELVRGKPTVEEKEVSAIKDKLNYRTRQNVLFEYGLFLGVLGREKVECLWDTKIREEPSDIKGVLNIQFEKSIKETFPDIDAKIEKITQKK
jgi:predicted nucleotide-binding protein